jgi:hypothetical protein
MVDRPRVDKVRVYHVLKTQYEPRCECIQPLSEQDTLDAVF